MPWESRREFIGGKNLRLRVREWREILALEPLEPQTRERFAKAIIACLQ